MMNLADLIKVAPTADSDASDPRATALDTAPLQITAAETAASEDDRFHRFRLIRWWDQAKLARAKVLLIGAGALGNEILKNLALLGVGNVVVVDMDRVENSNLSRSILYRATDNGSYKAEAAAAAARDVYPDMRTRALVANAVYDIGMGLYRWADVVMGGLDNREARLAINRNCIRVGRPFVDGAIEQISGTARVFAPDGPCYECTMSDTDWKLLAARRSCNLLSRGEMETGGRTPTTPTISSIIAGVQCQEAVKLLHNLPTLAGKGWQFDGFGGEAYTVEYQRKPTCYSHDPLSEIVQLEAGAATITVRDILDHARRLLGTGTQLELARDVLEKLVCPRCKAEEVLFASLGKVQADKAWCPACATDGDGESERLRIADFGLRIEEKAGASANPQSAIRNPQSPTDSHSVRRTRREPVTFYRIRGDESFLDRTPADIGVPALDILIARNPSDPGRAIGLELSWDAENVLGPLWDGEALEWS